MTIKVGINGFGRIGRCTLSHIAASARNDIEVIKGQCNRTALETSAHLLEIRQHPRAISARCFNQRQHHGPGTRSNGDVFHLQHEANLDWDGCDVVLECTGKFNDGLKAKTHLERGAQKVLLSGPGINVDRTIVYGVNHNSLTTEDKMVSQRFVHNELPCPTCQGSGRRRSASNSGIMTTIHAYTGDQPTLDRRHSDLYRARAAAMSMIPDKRQALRKRWARCLPNLKGRLDGSAIRVPTPNVSAVDLTFRATGAMLPSKRVNADREAKACSRTHAARSGLRARTPCINGFQSHRRKLEYSRPIKLASLMVDRMVRVLAWYDNEWAFSVRMADVAVAMGHGLTKTFPEVRLNSFSPAQVIWAWRFHSGTGMTNQIAILAWDAHSWRFYHAGLCSHTEPEHFVVSG